MITDISADNDQMVVDLERQLEEARHELAQKRKEDKELRGHELKQNIQISGVRLTLGSPSGLIPVGGRSSKCAEKSRTIERTQSEYAEDVRLAVWYVSISPSKS